MSALHQSVIIQYTYLAYSHVMHIHRCVRQDLLNKHTAISTI